MLISILGAQFPVLLDISRQYESNSRNFRLCKYHRTLISNQKLLKPITQAFSVKFN